MVVEETVEMTNSSTRNRLLRTELFLATTHLVESSIFCDVSNESPIYSWGCGLKNFEQEFVKKKAFANFLSILRRIFCSIEFTYQLIIIYRLLRRVSCFKTLTLKCFTFLLQICVRIFFFKDHPSLVIIVIILYLPLSFCRLKSLMLINFYITFCRWNCVSQIFTGM